MGICISMTLHVVDFLGTVLYIVTLYVSR
jgi:hypothetical protein